MVTSKDTYLLIFKREDKKNEKETKKENIFSIKVDCIFHTEKNQELKEYKIRNLIKITMYTIKEYRIYLFIQK